MKASFCIPSSKNQPKDHWNWGIIFMCYWKGEYFYMEFYQRNKWGEVDVTLW